MATPTTPRCACISQTTDSPLSFLGNAITIACVVLVGILYQMTIIQRRLDAVPVLEGKTRALRLLAKNRHIDARRDWHDFDRDTLSSLRSVEAALPKALFNKVLRHGFWREWVTTRLRKRMGVELNEGENTAHAYRYKVLCCSYQAELFFNRPIQTG